MVGSRFIPKRRRRRVPRVDLRRTLFVLPNLITLASIFCGFNAIRVVSLDNPTSDDFYRAAILLIFAMLFDLLDGRVARMTRTQSAFGMQLDSLVDIVSAGTTGAPVKPSKYTVGLPIPPASGILISLLFANHAVGGALSHERYTVAIFCVTVALSLLMVSSFRFRSFKELSFNVGTALMVMFAIGSSAFVWRFGKPQFVLVWLLSFYVLIGLVETVRAIPEMFRRRREEETETSLEQGCCHLDRFVCC